MRSRRKEGSGVIIFLIIFINFLNFCCCDDFFVECESDNNAHLFNGTETVTTFEIPISAFFLENEGQQLINATAQPFQNEASEIVKLITAAHEQEIHDIVKQFKSTRRKRFLSRLLSKFAHVGRRLYPRAESSLSRSSSIPQKTFDGTKWAVKSSSSSATMHVDKLVRGAKWAAKTSAQLGALYGATIIYDKLTGSSENFAMLKNATNFTLIKSTIDSSLNYAKNEKIHDLKMLLFFQKLNHLPFIVDYLKAIQSGWTDVERIHIKDDVIVIETKTKFYSISGKLCQKHFIGTFENGYYSYNSTSEFIDEKEVQNCDINMFEETFCFSKTFNSPPLNVSVNHCYRRRTKTRIIFVTNTEKYLKDDIQYDYPASGILVTSLKEKCELAIPSCGIFSLKHNEEHFYSYHKDLNTDEIIKMSQKLEEIEKKAADNQMFFTKLAKLFENDFLIKICLGIIMVAVTASILFCLLYINFICFCKKALPKIRGR